MTYASSTTFSSFVDPIPYSFNEWKDILTEWAAKTPSRFPTTLHSENSIKKKEKTSLPKNRVFGDNLLESFLVSPSSTGLHGSVGLSRLEVTKVNGGTTKRSSSIYHNPNNIKTSQKTTYVNENFLIYKLSKDRQAKQSNNNNIIDNSDSSDQNFSSTNKYSSLSSNLSTPSNKSMRTAAPSISTNQNYIPNRLSPILRIEGQKRRVQHQDDSSLISPGQHDFIINSNSNQNMSTALTANPTSNRSRLSNETLNANFLLSNDKYKSSNSMLRQTRPSLTTTTMPSIYLPTQSLQKSIQPASKSRLQQEKSTPSKELFEYPDPFSNCPPEVMSRLTQLSKFQAETVEWEKKKRFTKRKPTNQSNINGKESP